jgi:GT2 family glycosyltransferase
MTTKVSIVIPVYGQWDLAKRNIDSLLKHDGENIAEIIVVDDCSVEINPFNFDNEHVKVIKNPRNLGYAGTVNNGLRAATSTTIILLDSDAYLISPIVGKLQEILDADPQTGCVGFTSVGDQGQITGSFQYEPTLTGYLVGQSVEDKLSKLLISKKSRIIPFSCCLGFRKQCLEDVQYFDDLTFPQVEADVDLGLRIHESKWKLSVTRKILISHQGGHSYKINSRRVRLYHEGKWKLLRKHKLMRSPEVIRTLLKLRVGLEILTMQGLKLLGSETDPLMQKIAGRKELLKDIDNYA